MPVLTIRKLDNRHSLIPRQLGYREQPQNDCPAWRPFFAVRLTIGALHFGQLGALSSDGAAPLLGGEEEISSTRLIIEFRILPSIRSSLVCFANSHASSVNSPLVTKIPPVALRAFTKPNNSLAMRTPTFSQRQCLHCTRNASLFFFTMRSMPPSAPPRPVSSTE